MFIIVSTPNRIVGLRWMYDSEPNQIRAEVTRVPKPIVNRTAHSTIRE